VVLALTGANVASVAAAPEVAAAVVMLVADDETFALIAPVANAVGEAVDVFEAVSVRFSMVPAT
jgi:hypothetical protein